MNLQLWIGKRGLLFVSKKSDSFSSLVVVFVYSLTKDRKKKKKVVKQPRESNDLHRMPFFVCVYPIPYPLRASSNSIFRCRHLLYFMLEKGRTFLLFGIEFICCVVRKHSAVDEKKSLMKVKNPTVNSSEMKKMCEIGTTHKAWERNAEWKSISLIILFLFSGLYACMHQQLKGSK